MYHCPYMGEYGRGYNDMKMDLWTKSWNDEWKYFTHFWILYSSVIFSQLPSWFGHNVENLENNDKKSEGIKIIINIVR